MKKLNLKNGKKLELKKTAIASLSENYMKNLFGGGNDKPKFSRRPDDLNGDPNCTSGIPSNDNCSK